MDRVLGLSLDEAEAWTAYSLSPSAMLIRL